MDVDWPQDIRPVTDPVLIWQVPQPNAITKVALRVA